MTKEQIENKAKEKLRKYTTEQLLDQWEIICKMEATRDVIRVRGWILGALEEKNPEALERFYDSYDQDLALRSYVLQ